VPVDLFGMPFRRSLARSPHLGFFPIQIFTVIKPLTYVTFFINYRSVLLDRAAPWLTDGLRWLRLVIADHIPVPNVGDPPLVVSASLFVLVALFFSSSLVVFVVLRQRRLSFNNRAKDNIEMAINTSSIRLDTGTSCKSLCDGAAETCPSYNHAAEQPMDVDMEEVEKSQVTVESCTEGRGSIGLPFPGSLLADGTFAVEYHDM
jgi:hypothetical protein